MYNNIYSVEEIMPNTDYMLFKKGIRPEWEDVNNRPGGKWVVTLPIQDDMEEECGQAWLRSLVTLISGQIDRAELDFFSIAAAIASSVTQTSNSAGYNLSQAWQQVGN